MIKERVKNTPSPWMVDDNGEQYLILGQGQHIATVPKGDDPDYCDRANAHLIAHAPDLKDRLLKRSVENHEFRGHCCSWADCSEFACHSDKELIAKAEGPRP